jgi:hypothetical protein
MPRRYSTYIVRSSVSVSNSEAHFRVANGGEWRLAEATTSRASGGDDHQARGQRRVVASSALGVRGRRQVALSGWPPWWATSWTASGGCLCGRVRASSGNSTRTWRMKKCIEERGHPFLAHLSPEWQKCNNICLDYWRWIMADTVSSGRHFCVCLRLLESV